MKTMLEKIIENKRQEIEQIGYFQTLESVVENLPHVGTACDSCDAFVPNPGKPDFIAAIRSAPIGLIAEVKRRSPSAGTIRVPFNPSEIASAYQKAGAQAVSCLMDKEYFGGGEEQWSEVHAATTLPMLYKEFVIDPRQIFHADALGASAVLLIVAALTNAELRSLIQLVEKSSMTALVEVHTEEEMKRAIAAEAKCIGINNRNLKTFETDIATSLKLCKLAPPDCTLISESGIRTVNDIRTLHAAGFSAVLVGESLLRQVDLEAATKNLMRI